MIGILQFSEVQGSIFNSSNNLNHLKLLNDSIYYMYFQNWSQCLILEPFFRCWWFPTYFIPRQLFIIVSDKGLLITLSENKSEWSAIYKNCFQLNVWRNFIFNACLLRLTFWRFILEVNCVWKQCLCFDYIHEWRRKYPV